MTDNFHLIDLVTVTLNLKPFHLAAPQMQEHIFVACITELQALQRHKEYGLTDIF